MYDEYNPKQRAWIESLKSGKFATSTGDSVMNAKTAREKSMKACHQTYDKKLKEIFNRIEIQCSNEKFGLIVDLDDGVTYIMDKLKGLGYSVSQVPYTGPGYRLNISWH